VAPNAPSPDLVDRIELCARRALDDRRASRWRGWYARQRSWIVDMASRLPFTLHQVAGAIAALSPRVRWDYQRQHTEAAFRAYEAGTSLRYLGTHRNLRKAEDILGGLEPEDVLSGAKVRAFYANLTGDEGEVTIDAWAIRVAFGEDVVLTDKRVRDAAEAYRVVAGRLGLTPAECQALTWCARREGAA